MIKEILAEKEPVVYACLKNDLQNDRLSHSYLLCGEKNPLKKDTAYLLASSILEGKNDFADEESTEALRIRENRHLDVLYIDGKEEIIKKDDIENVLKEFSKTAAERSGRKVYIIDNINNSTNKVLNMILKFMEEPANGNTYGIFISDDADNLLETVVSRCEKLNFVSTDYSYIKDIYLSKGYEEMDAYLLSVIRHEYIEEDDDYMLSKDTMYSFVDSLNKPDSIPLIFYNDVFPLKNMKEVVDMFLQLMIRILDDSIVASYLDESEYNSLLTRVKGDALMLLEIFLDTKAKREENPSADVKLLIDQLCCKIIKYKSGKTYE